LLALLSMGDVPALDIVVEKAGLPRGAHHPYASKPEADRPSLTPLQYLLYENPDPPHGFTDEQIIDVLRKIAKDYVPEDWEPTRWSHAAIPDRLFGELARLATPRWFSWIPLILERVKSSGEKSALRGWVPEMLQHERLFVRQHVIESLDEAMVTRERALVEKCLEVDG